MLTILLCITTVHTDGGFVRSEGVIPGEKLQYAQVGLNNYFNCIIFSM